MDATASPYFLYPPFVGPTSTANHLIDASGEKVAATIQISPSNTGAIRKIAVRLGTVTTGQTIRVSCQDLGSDGNPDGTADQSGTVAVADSDDNTWKQVTLDADRTLAVGSIAIVTEFSSSVGNLNVLGCNGADFNSAFVNHFTSSWSKPDRMPIAAVELADGSYPYLPGVIPALPTTAGGSSTQERCNRIVIPAPMRVVGVRWGGFAPTNGTIMAVLYNSSSSSPTLLASGSIDGDFTSNGANYVHDTYFSSAYELAPGTYHYGIRPDGSVNITTRLFNGFSAAALSQMGGGTGCYQAVRTNASGAWTYTDTSRFGMSLIVDGLSAGGGGPLVGGRLVRA